MPAIMQQQSASTLKDETRTADSQQRLVEAQSDNSDIARNHNLRRKEQVNALASPSNGIQPGPSAGIRVIGYHPPASASAQPPSQLHGTNNSPEPRPSWEMRLAALRRRRESASAERSAERDLRATVGLQPSASSIEERDDGDDVVRCSWEVARARRPSRIDVVSASPFSSVLSTPTSGDDGDSDASSHLPLRDFSLVATTTSSATTKEGASATGRPGRTAEGGYVPPVPLAPRASGAAEIPPLPSSTPSITSSVSGSLRHGMASTQASTEAERPAATSATRPPLRRMPSSVSATSTATFAEAPIHDRSFGVFFWRDSPPSHPLRAAPMQSDSNSSGEEEEPDMAPFDDERVRAGWFVETPPPGSCTSEDAEPTAAARNGTAVPDVTQRFLEHIALLQRPADAPAVAPLPTSSTPTASAKPSTEEAATTSMQGTEKKETPSIATLAPLHSMTDSAVGGASSQLSKPQMASERAAVSGGTERRRRYPKEKAAAHRPGSRPRPHSSFPPMDVDDVNSLSVSADTIAATAAPSPMSNREEEAAGTEDHAAAAPPRAQLSDPIAEAKGSAGKDSTHSTKNAPSVPAVKNTIEVVEAVAMPSDRLRTRSETSGAVVASAAPLREAYAPRPRSDAEIAAAADGARTQAEAAPAAPPTPFLQQSKVTNAEKKVAEASKVPKEASSTASSTFSASTQPTIRSPAVQTQFHEKSSAALPATRNFGTTVTPIKNGAKEQKPPAVADTRPATRNQRGNGKSQHPYKESASQQKGTPPAAATTSALPPQAAALMNPPPLTQFKAPHDMFGPQNVRSAAVRPVKELAPAAFDYSDISVSAPTPVSDAKRESEKTNLAVHLLKHRTPADSSAVPQPRQLPLPRLTQRPSSMRPLLSQLVSKAMHEVAPREEVSVSTTTSASSTAELTSPARGFCNAVAAPSDFARPVMPGSEMHAPAPTSTSSHVPSPGSSPEAKKAKSRSPLHSPSPPRYLEPNQPDWHNSLVAGVRLRRDSPHMCRPSYPSRERSQSGRIAPAWNTNSPGAWDGLMRSVSARRDASLMADSAATSSVTYATFRGGGPAGDRKMSSTASRGVPVRPLLSTAVYPAFNATTVGSTETLMDTAVAASLLAPEDVQLIREELELQNRLHKLKVDSLRLRAERYH